MSKYEVYIARIGSKVMYIGEGMTGRHVHITSGTSHCYEANRAHFRGDKVTVEVLPKESKEAARELEVELIQTLEPSWNKSDNRWQDLMTVRKTIRKVIKKAKYRKITNPLQRDVLDYLSGKFNIEGICEVSISEMYSNCKVHTGFMSKMQDSRGDYYLQLKEFVSIERLPDKGDYLCTWVYDPDKTTF